MDELDSIIRQINEEFGEETIATASETPRPEQAIEKQAIDDFMERNPMAGGGMLVQPGFGGTRQGYATPGTGANQFTVMKEKAEKFLKGKKEIKQSDFIKELKKIGYKDPQAFSSVIANRNNVKLIRDVSLKRSPISLTLFLFAITLEKA